MLLKKLAPGAEPLANAMFNSTNRALPFLLPQEANYKKGNSLNSRNGLDREVSVPGAFKLDHLQPVKPILFLKFSKFCTFILGAISYYPRRPIMRKGNSPNSRNGLDRGVWVPGAFKLDHLHPVEPILFSKFYNFFTLILGPNSYYPRGLIMEKREFSHLQKWTRERGFSAWGIQTGPVAAL